MKHENPFVISVYKKPEFFCNRTKETQKLVETYENNRNITLFSPRKMGKTGLIYHLFYHLRNKNVNTFYIDLFNTTDLNQFLQQMANAVLRTLTTDKESFIKRALKIFSKVRPVFSLDEYNTIPSVSFTVQSDVEKQNTLQEIFELLENQKRPNIFALDEFQQINFYPEKNMEQILRSYIQQMNNTHFIFSGSQKHLLIPMFTEVKKPFYQSSDFLALAEIAHEDYQKFIMNKFCDSGRKINVSEIDYILNWTKHYTFYTQCLCNKLYSKGFKIIQKKNIDDAILEIFSERETIYFNYSKLLPGQQFRLLNAIASDGIVTEPTSGEFIKKYNLGTPSTVSKCLKGLIEKEIVYEMLNDDKPTYQIYDVFLSRWLEMRNFLYILPKIRV